MEQGTIKRYPGKLVFGLDIGTRSIVGTVGYKNADKFHVIVQRSVEHETRSMLDGQIHDIARVGNTISQVKEQLEDVLGLPLKDVCIAAAGRVLRTVTVHTENSFEDEKEITPEDIYELDSKGVEQAYEEFSNLFGTDKHTKFFCVGYSVIRYYLGGYAMATLEGHKSSNIAVDLIATFLPEDVVDGLYKAVEQAGLSVVNMTLEPIAAISLAIPEKYRMLNIALVDVGAGTSDISITEKGSITSYGMIPIAGDALTEAVAHHCLVDFSQAERIKRDMDNYETIQYEDILGLSQSITREQLAEVLAPVIDSMTEQVTEKIKELNGGRSVGAVFVVGGGGKVPGYTRSLARKLGIQEERVALRGKEVMDDIYFMEDGVKKDSLLVTPIGICLTYYAHSNAFIFVTFNKRRLKLYDNNRLAVVDAAMQAAFPNDGLFPKRGKALTFSVDGKSRMVRGSIGEAAVITVNGNPGDIYTPIRENDVIQVLESTAGEPGRLEVGSLPEYSGSITVIVNDTPIVLPKFVSVNGKLESAYYEIQEGDVIEMLSYYTVEQIAQFMDVVVNQDMHIYVNNKLSDMSSKVYENFSVIWTMEELFLNDVENYPDEKSDVDVLSAGFSDLPEGKVEYEKYREKAELDGAEDRGRRPVFDDEDKTPGGLKVSPEELASLPVVGYTNSYKLENGVITKNINIPDEYMSKLPPGAVVPNTVTELSANTGADEDKGETSTLDKKPAESSDNSSDKSPVSPLDMNPSNTFDKKPDDNIDNSRVNTSDGSPVAAADKGSDMPMRAEAAAEHTPANHTSATPAPSPVSNSPLSKEPGDIMVIVNGKAVKLTGKKSYMFANVFDYIDFDLSRPKGRGIVTMVNGAQALYMQELKEGDKIDIYWRE